MSVMIVFQQMLVLFAMMVAGYICYKKGIIEEKGTKTISALIVNLLNPFLIVACVLGDGISYSGEVIKQNVIMVVIMFVLLIILSKVIVAIFRVGRADAGSYQLMLTFSNLGFMGIPLISNIYGEKAVILVAFYMLGYNMLIYTYGLFLAINENESGEGAGFRWKKMINPGVVGCIVAIMIFAFEIKIPSFIGSFADYMGNAAVPMAMIMVGVSLAKIPLRSIVQDVRLLVMTLIKLLVIPIASTFIFRNLGFDSTVFGVFIILLATPAGSIVILIEKEYGREDNSLCAKGIALTTILALVTIPIVAMFI